jgi:hypothetical protein
MPDTDLPWVFTEPLEGADIPYMIVGAFATMTFGVIRTTEDLDLVLGLSPADVTRLAKAFPDEEYYRPRNETLLIEIARSERGHFNLIHHASLNRADCYLSGRDPLQLWALRNRRRVEWQGRKCWVAPPEVVILKKLEFYREGESQKHVYDIKNILKVVDVDLGFIEEFVAKSGLEKQWQQFRPDSQ